MFKRLLQVFMMGMIILSFPSCNGVLDGLYDESKEPQLGFSQVNLKTKTGRIYIDATSYTAWTFVDLDAKMFRIEEITEKRDTVWTSDDSRVAAVQIKSNLKNNDAEENPWSFAMHRYDVKTNGGAVMETQFTNLVDLMYYGKLPEGVFTEDINDRVIVDMSLMMNNGMIYTPSNVNVELSKWISTDLSQMPPIYTPSNKVYIVKFPDGVMAALRFVNYMNMSNEKGFITIDYVYPLEF